jgi:hypothetical protein
VENNKKIKVITFSGKAESGKDASAQYIRNLLQEEGHQVISISLADYLKFALEKYLNLGLSYHTKEEMRQHYQQFGTEHLRRLNPNFHIDLIIDIIKALNSYTELDAGETIFIVPDVRFDNELEGLFDNFDIFTFKVERPNYESQLSEEELNHSSENGIKALDDEWDAFIVNDGNREDLDNKLDKAYDKLIEYYELKRLD